MSAYSVTEPSKASKWGAGLLVTLYTIITLLPLVWIIPLVAALVGFGLLLSFITLPLWYWLLQA